MRDTLIISLGGSLIVPDGIDTVFLMRFKKLIERYSRSIKFIIICGGGSAARSYTAALRKLRPSVSSRELDQMGIVATYMNAMLVKSIFGSRTHEAILTNPQKFTKSSKNIIIGSGWLWRSGHSTDYVSVVAAKNFGANTIVNLSNISYVYNKDPKKFQGAKPFKTMTWRELRRIVGNTWTPGAHVPFDPEAAKLAERLKLELIIMNGKNLAHFKNFLEDKKFTGTRVV